MNDLEVKHRLLAMREYLDVRARVDAPDFEREVLSACRTKIASIVGPHPLSRGDDVMAHLASQLGVRFEEVRSPTDIKNLEERYLAKKEIGFGQLSLELSDPDVDALLLKRMYASERDSDQWVAVLNLQESESRCYWNKSHELSHRLTEPPQREMRFRHRASEKNKVERIVDLVAADVAFFKPLFTPLVSAKVSGQLGWNTIDAIRAEFAPTSSRMAIANAVMENCSIPVFLLTAKMKGRKRNPQKDVALRISVTGWNDAAKRSGMFLIQNMRVPETSPIHRAFLAGMLVDDLDRLGEWSTSDGSRLPSRTAFVSARPYAGGVFAVLTLI